MAYDHGQADGRSAVMGLSAKHERALDDLRHQLEDWAYEPDGDTWQDVVEEAMNTAWDALLRAGDPE